MLGFWSYSLKRSNSDLLLNSGLILINIGILILFFQTLEFWSYSSKRWSSGPILMNVEFCCYPQKHWNFLASFLKALEFSSYPPKHWNSAGIPHIPVALPLFVALIASNASLNSGFSSRNTVFSLSVMASKAERWYLSSYVKKFVKVVCKSMENLSFLLYYCLTIKVSKLCCTPLLWPSYFSQTIVKSFRVFFFPAICCNSSAFAPYLWDFISLLYCCRFRRVPVSFVLPKHG